MNNKAAGEREGARPASQSKIPPLKKLDLSSFLDNGILKCFQNTRRLKRSQKSQLDFFDKLKKPPVGRFFYPHNSLHIQPEATKQARSAHNAAGMAQRLSFTPAAEKYTAATYRLVSLAEHITAAVRPMRESGP